MHLLFLPIFLPALALHFLPTIIAGVRHARNFGWILLVNVLLSWTVIGWIVALIWSIRDTPRYAFTYVPPPPPPYNMR